MTSFTGCMWMIGFLALLSLLIGVLPSMLGIMTSDTVSFVWSAIHPASSDGCSQAARKARIREVCEKYNMENQTDPDDPRTYSRLLVDDQHKVIYCVIPKNACSTWKAVLATQTGRISIDALIDFPNKHLHDFNYLKKQSGLYLLDTVGNMEGIRSRLQNYYTFLVTRNPYTRLYSGYTDKFVVNSSYSAKFMKKAHSMFPELQARKSPMSLPQLLLALTGTNTNASETLTNAFRDALLSDVHFRTQHSQCHPCIVNYDYIVKVETMGTDSVPLLSRLNASHVPKLNNMKAFKRQIVSLEDGMSSMPNRTAEELLKIYKLDFEMFGYSSDVESVRQKDWCENKDT